MKPLGLKPFHHKQDHRIHRKHRKVKNWWADREPNKAMAKRQAEQEIKNQLNDSE